MGKYIVSSGNKLSGEIAIGGAKNAVLPIIAGSILNKGVSIIHNCPKISDTFLSIEILKYLGCDVTLNDNTLFIDSSQLNKITLPVEFVTPMRSSIIFLGALLGREKECTIGYPGGCELGKRPIDLHLLGLRSLGAEISEEKECINAKVSTLVGNKINLTFPSVGATENIMLGAVLAEGVTTIVNAAKEPEIVDLQNFLNKMGAKITGAGTDVILIEGVKSLNNVEYTIMPDRIVTGTYMAGTIMTGGEVLFKNINEIVISTFYKELCATGAKFTKSKDGIFLKSPKIINPIAYLETAPHPGFPTDMQSQMVALLSLARGKDGTDGIDNKSTIVENIFESRTKHIDELVKMGANITIDNIGSIGTTFNITGVSKLVGTDVYAKDLRGGASLILAGLVADGKTCVHNACYVQRGYENIATDLSSLGADIKFVADEVDNFISA